jgi:hypothetical protein
MTELNPGEIIKLVRQSLENRHPQGIAIDVIEEGIRRQNGSWYVPVRPSVQPPKTFEYYEALAEVESELEENEQVSVLLVPSLPIDRTEDKEAEGKAVNLPS